MKVTLQMDQKLLLSKLQEKNQEIIDYIQDKTEIILL